MIIGIKIFFIALGAMAFNCSTVTACETSKLPLLVRLSEFMWAPQPSFCPKSWQIVRTYVPLLHATLNFATCSLASQSKSSNFEMRIKRGSRSTSLPFLASL